ncbi:Ig-like domain-containing protein [Gaopeijia maritima]|uniref:Ig-like domain-containing protein n=1 Tax=Gaopeijia maritima TaxID=3119007 RepID=A0ABU9E7T3_9BACT
MTRIRSALVLAFAAGVAACSDGNQTLPAPVVDQIVIAPESGSVTTLGATIAFDAEARTSTGVPVAGLSFDWTSSNTSVATVDANGVATAVGFGEATITAEVDGVSAGAIFSVRDCTASVALAPGEWTALAVPAAGDCGVILPAGSAGDRYRVAVVSTDTTRNGAAVSNVAVDIVPLGTTALTEPAAPAATSAAPSAAVARALRVRGLGEAARMAEHTALAHDRMRADEARILGALGPDAVLRESTSARSPARQVQNPTQTISLDPNTSSCEATDNVLANLVYFDDRLAFYQDAEQAQTSLAVTAQQAQRMAEFYRDFGEPVIDAYYDGVSDIDNNDRVIVFITPEVVFPTAAFVWSGDFFEANASTGCAASNEGEYIYFSAEVMQLQDDVDGPGWQSLETLVHEMKHVSSLYRSVLRPRGQQYHPSWVEEGTAEIAGNMATRLAWSSVGGPAINARIDDEDIIDTGFDASTGDIKPEFFGVAIRMLRAQGFLASQPNGLVVSPNGALDDHSVYGSGWTFFRWLGDSYGNAASAPMADADLFKSLNATAAMPGVRGLEDELGVPFPRLLERFAAAVMFHATPNAPTGLDFTGYDFPTAIEVFCFAADNPACSGSAPGPTGYWPWPVTTNSDGTPSWTLQQPTEFSGSIGPAGLRIHDFVSNGTGTGAELVISAPAQARIVVARIQ